MSKEAVDNFKSFVDSFKENEVEWNDAYNEIIRKTLLDEFSSKHEPKVTKNIDVPKVDEELQKIKDILNKLNIEIDNKLLKLPIYNLKLKLAFAYECLMNGTLKKEQLIEINKLYKKL